MRRFNLSLAAMIGLVCFIGCNGSEPAKPTSTNAPTAPIAKVEIKAENKAGGEGGAWGDITGRIVFGSDKLPALAPLNLKNHPDTNVCEAKGKLADETWVVNSENKGLRDVFVWLEPLKKDDNLPIHPKLKEVEPKKVEVDQPMCLFVSRAIGLREGQILVAKNSSTIAHNFKWEGGPEQSSGNVLLAPGNSHEIKNFVAKRVPVAVGAFTIKNAPTGDYVLKIWHESGWPGGAAGRAGQPITIKAGENKVKDFPFPPS